MTDWKGKTAIVLFFSWIFVFSIWGIGFWVVYWNSWGYTYDKNVNANYTRATTTNDLGEATDYLQEAYDWLNEQGFEGNPNLWYPTDETEWDLVLKDLRDIVRTARESDNNTKPGEDAYEEALKTLDDKVNGGEDEDGIKDQTDNCYNKEYLKRNIVQIILYWILFPTVIILACVFGAWSEEYVF